MRRRTSAATSSAIFGECSCLVVARVLVIPSRS
jgi:hypothetical protein